jgi:alkylation response protein AidB-like acyl-CoA dehydrogenase
MPFSCLEAAGNHAYRRLLLPSYANRKHNLWEFPGMSRYLGDSPTGRLLRDAKLYEIGAGTSGTSKEIAFPWFYVVAQN